MAWDVTFVDTLAESHLPGTTAVEDAEREKNKKYAHLADQYIFYPIGFETIGSWGPSAREILQPISKRILQHTGKQRTMEFLQVQSWERSISQLI